MIVYSWKKYSIYVTGISYFREILFPYKHNLSLMHNDLRLAYLFWALKTFWFLDVCTSVGEHIHVLVWLFDSYQTNKRLNRKIDLRCFRHFFFIEISTYIVSDILLLSLIILHVTSLIVCNVKRAMQSESEVRCK